LDSEFLKTLIAVQRHGSIAAAARAQGLTPAAVSQRIRSLEIHFQTSLFSRAGKTVQPSEDCLRILPAIRVILDDIERLSSLIAKDGLQGTLRIGAIGTMLSGFIPKSITYLKEKAPALTLEIHPGTSPLLYEELVNGRIDLALIVAPPFELPKQISSHIIRREHLCIVSAHQISASLADLCRTTPYIQYNPSSWGGRLAEKYVRDQKLQPDIFCTIDALSTTAKMVSQGLGFSLLPNWMRDKGEDFGALWTPIEDMTYARDIILIHASNPAKASAIRAFKSAAQL